MYSDGVIYECTIRKKIKNSTEISVGDFVEIENGIIELIYKRKNRLIRPYASNIDIMIIVVAKVPKPDWIMVEKLLLDCHMQNIKPVLCVNKIDLMEESEISEFVTPYINDLDIVKISTVTSYGQDVLYNLINGKTICFAGQSAVGKTSIINNILGAQNKVGGLSKRIERGKNTTRQVEIFVYGDTKLVDTCGFSVLTAADIKYDELKFFYGDYVAIAKDCRYPDCTHTTEPDCAVKKAFISGKINNIRYERYVTLFNEMKENWRKKYE